MSQGSSSYLKGKLTCRLRKQLDEHMSCGSASARSKLRLKSPSALSQQVHRLTRSKFETVKSPDIVHGPEEETYFEEEPEADGTRKKPRFLDINKPNIDIEQIKRGSMTQRTREEEKVSPKSILKNRQTSFKLSNKEPEVVVAFAEAIAMDLQKRRFSEPKRMKLQKQTDKQAVDDTTADTTKLFSQQ